MASPQPKYLSAGKNPWTAFRALCKLYASCVTASEDNAELHELSRKGVDFDTVQPPPRWLDDDNSGTDFDISLAEYGLRSFYSTLVTRKEFDEEVYIAYPCIFYRDDKRTKARRMVPVFLIPVDIRFHGNYKAHVTPHPEQALLNEKALEQHLTTNTLRRMVSAYFSQKRTNLLLSVLACLAHLTGTDLNPRMTAASVGDEDGKPQNIAMLCVGMALRYNRTLRRELRQIEGVPDDVLDTTALAYVFRDPPLTKPAPGADEVRVPLEFLNSNYRQFCALQEALNSPCTKIQGPPGTGKSYTAVNLLLNLAANGESALFTSRNHQAIHAIDDLVAKCMEGENGQGLGFEVIQFCSAPDDRLMRHPWYKANIDTLKAQAAMAKASRTMDLSEAIARYRELAEGFRQCWDMLERRRALVVETEKLERDRAVLSALCRIDPPEPADARTWAALRVVKDGVATGFLRRLRFILSGGHKRLASAESYLRSRYKDFYAAKRSDLAQDIERHLGYVDRMRTDADASMKVQAEAASLPSYDELLEKACKLLKGLHEVATPLLCSRIAEYADEVDDRLIPTVRSLAARIPQDDTPFYITQVDKKLSEDLTEAFRRFTGCFPVWVSTILSLPLAAPCSPAILDRVIIDEAAQCDIPAIVPALFRAKAVTVIGDPEQFPPIVKVTPQRYSLLRRNAGYPQEYEFGKFCYRESNAFNVVPGAAIMLEEHRRCADGIAAYFSEAFYGGNLQVVETPPPGKDRDPLLDFPSYMGYKSSLTWEDVPDGNDEEELARVEEQLDRILQLPEANRRGITIGIVSPLHRVAEKLKECLRPYYGRFAPGVLSESSVGTAYAFQGGTKGVIIFVLGLNRSTKPGENWYIEDGRNRSIYNVAVSRAKFCCVVVGDQSRARNSSLKELRKLAQPPRETQSHDNGIGPGEGVLQAALERLGLHPVPQYRLMNRRLDLALTDSRIDIEVDGAAWHLNARGNRNQDDIFRDRQVEIAGWVPYRIWHKEVMDDPDGVAKAILEYHQKRLRELGKV